MANARVEFAIRHNVPFPQWDVPIQEVLDALPATCKARPLANIEQATDIRVQGRFPTAHPFQPSNNFGIASDGCSPAFPSPDIGFAGNPIFCGIELIALEAGRESIGIYLRCEAEEDLPLGIARWLLLHNHPSPRGLAECAGEFVFLGELVPGANLCMQCDLVRPPAINSCIRNDALMFGRHLLFSV